MQGIGSNFNVYILKEICFITVTLLLLLLLLLMMLLFREGICYPMQLGGTKKYLSCFKIYAIAFCLITLLSFAALFPKQLWSAPQVSNYTLQFLPGS